MVFGPALDISAHTVLEAQCIDSLALDYLHRKLADGLFLQSCAELAELYPKIKYETIIIDNCCMQVLFPIFYWWLTMRMAYKYSKHIVLCPTAGAESISV